MKLIRKLKRGVRGEVKPKTLVLETFRRVQSSRQGRKERESLDRTNTEMPKLWLGEKDDLLSHFRNRVEPRFFPGFLIDSIAGLLHGLFPEETKELLRSARLITEDHAWPLLGFGVKEFGEEIEWCRDPLSGYLWPLDYHREIQLIRNDGSDARVLWEVNRFGHLLTLANAYAVSGDARFSKECVSQLQSWTRQNPYGRGVNWTCAMEVALRSMNLLAVFEVIKHSTQFDIEALHLFLRLFHQHGTFIRNNLEFSYIATSNHYLSDLAGLVWLGIMLPEFRESENWRDFGWIRMLGEMDKQVLPDGADFESSTGYHRFVLELFLYSFILGQENEIEIENKYWEKLRAMLEFMRRYLRPDGLAPLIGDCDGGRVLPICPRRADEHAYVLAIGAATFKDGVLRPPNFDAPPELLWILGAKGLDEFQSLSAGNVDGSRGFPYAGLYVMRKGDLWLLFNTSDAGLRGRGSHGHNDALSIEVAAGGRAFIVDPGSYVYTADLRQRHLFRSTAYHSTARIDGEEQNTTIESIPFVIGNEAKPRVLAWETAPNIDRVVAEHSGYLRLTSPLTHRRTVLFYRDEGYWLIEDEFSGDGEHECEVRFHFAPGLEVYSNAATATAIDPKSRMALSVTSLDLKSGPVLEDHATSRDYGELKPSVTARWHISGLLGKLRWKVAPESDAVSQTPT